ncbi:MAG: hypothetical protein K0B07_00085 [DPANN group archaeon]|nr:hypothetical protein [DPANN group archaeon]
MDVVCTEELTLKEAYMQDLGYSTKGAVSQYAVDYSCAMPCFQSRDKQEYSGESVWFEIPMCPETFEDAYTREYLDSLLPYQSEEYWSKFMPLLLEEIRQNICDATERAEKWQNNALPYSVRCG